MIFRKLSEKITNPPVLVESNQFVVKFAENKDEISRALRLRYEVFNLEQGKGLNISPEHGIDEDEFDEFCLHMITIDKVAERVVGTYRVHLGTIAKSAIGFYSAREYDMHGMNGIEEHCIEVGRSCVHPDYRSGSAVAMLWQGIAVLMIRSKLRYLLGCVSLEDTSPAAAWALYYYLKEKYGICKIMKAQPQPEFILEKPSEAELAKFRDDKLVRKAIPPLFKGYLRLGAVICGEPALDREFGTIDFLIILDTSQLPERYQRHFKMA